MDVYLDVDGVLLPVYDPGNGPTLTEGGFGRWAPIRGRAYEMCSVDMLERLEALAAHPHVHVHWCTTWAGEPIRALAAGLGLPAWDHVDEDRAFLRGEVVTASSWWKRDAVQHHHASRDGNAVLWVDDDLPYDGGQAREWLAGLGAGPDGWWLGMAVCPRTAAGLTVRDFERMEEFVNAHAPRVR